MVDTPRHNVIPSGQNRLITQILLTLAAIFFMANLSAIVDFIMHPEIAYFDEEHLFVGAITGLMTGVILFGIMFYVNRMDKSIRRQQRNEKALAASEEKYRSIFESSVDVIFYITPGGKFIDINPAGVKLFGYDNLEELLSLDISEDLYTSYDEWVMRQQRLEKQGVLENYELQMKKKNGDIIYVVETATAVYDDGGNVIASRGMMRDVTHLKQMERKLSQAQKLESIGRLAGGIAHDFNNYLTTINGQAEMIAARISTDELVIKGLEEIRSSIEKASGLTRQLLLFGHNQPLNVEPVDLNKQIEIISRQLSDALGNEFMVQIAPGDIPCVVEADVTALSQVLINLALSSRSRMAQAGHLSMTIEPVILDEAYALTHAEAYPGNFICMSLRDDGECLDEAALTHYFEPFFSFDTGQGGMVLAVSYGIITRHGGWIDLESISGAGTTYRIFLPASDQEIRPRARIGSQVRGHGERILLVEDEEAVRHTIERMLSNNGYEVLSAVDAESAFDLFVSKKGDIQLIFSDVMLPGESGVELVEHLRSHKADLPVVLSSGYTDRESDLNTIIDKDYRFLQKPFSLADLLEVVQETLAAPTSALLS